MSKRHIFAAVAGSREHCCFSDVDAEEYQRWAFAPTHTLLCYDEVGPIWWTGLANACVVSLCRYKYPGRDRTYFVALTDEGHVFHIGKEEGFVEKIPEAGIDADDAEGFGQMSRVRQIGLHLYALGNGGQVYQRSLAGAWRHHDDGLLQPHDADDTLFLDDIDGTGPDDLYVVGLKGCVRWFDGADWHVVAMPTTAGLSAVLVEDADYVWICGKEGTLLLGNARDGFDALETGTHDHLITMAMFRGALYFGTAKGVMAYDHRCVRAVETGLVPALADGHIVDAVDGTLWSFGYTDIARFDGTHWCRCPAEPPEGERPAPPPPEPAARRSRGRAPTSAERFADELADRINCYRIGDWLEKLAALGGVPLEVPATPREPVTIALEPIGLTVTLRRADAPSLPPADQVVVSKVVFAVDEAVLPFGLDAATLDPAAARAMLSDDTAGGRSVDIKRGDTRMSFFLDDARVVGVTFAPSLVGAREVTLVRLGGDVDYAEIDALFGPERLGVGG